MSIGCDEITYFCTYRSVVIIHLTITVNLRGQLPIDKDALPDLPLFLSNKDDIVQTYIPMDALAFLLRFNDG